jgi:hypothetical protein
LCGYHIGFVLIHLAKIQTAPIKKWKMGSNNNLGGIYLMTVSAGYNRFTGLIDVKSFGIFKYQSPLITALPGQSLQIF